MRLIYWVLSLLYQCIAPVHLHRRVKAGKELPDRYKEKLGLSDIQRPPGKLIWFHAASNGELNSVIPVIRELSSTIPELHFLITTVTLSSASIFARAKLDRAIHKFAPLDCPSFVHSFLSHWQPSLGIFIDSELWPNLLQAAHKSCKLIMMNGRLSDKSFKRWCYTKKSASYLYGFFDRIYPTSLDDMQKIRHFVPPEKLQFINNLKYIAHPDTIDQAELQSMQNDIGDRKFWLAASTHIGEFSKIMAVAKELKKMFPDLLTLIAPRHCRNASLIAAEASQRGLSYTMHSSDPIKGDVHIFDTISNLLLLYKLADVVFVGGSLIPRGGQNMFEPCRFGCAIIVGPYTYNFRNVVKDMQDAKALISVKDEHGLQEAVAMLLVEQQRQQEFARSAESLSGKGGGILSSAVREIKKYL